MATYYLCIDPVSGNDAGPKQTTQAAAEATPFRTWAAAFTAAAAADTNYFLGKRGTTATENVVVQRTGAADKIQTIDGGAWGTGPWHHLTGASAGAVTLNANAKQYIHYKNLEVSGGTHGIRNFGTGTTEPVGTVLTDIYVHDTTSDGVRIGGVNTGSGTWTVTMTRVNVKNAGAFGIEIQGGVDHVINDCHVRGSNITQVINAWGIHTQGVVTQYTSSDTTLVSGTIYNITVPASTTVASVTVGGSSVGNYILTAGTFGALLDGEFGQSGTTLQVHLGEAIGSLTIRAVFQLCDGAILTGCTASGVRFQTGETNDGTGIGFDHGSKDCEAVRCVSQSNDGHGFDANVCNSVALRTCISLDNGASGFGLHRGAGTYTVNECTSKGNTESAITLTEVGVGGVCGANAAIRGFLAIGSTIALKVEGASAGWTESGCRYHGASTVGFLSGTEISGSDPTATVAGLPFPIAAVGGGVTSGGETDDYRRITRAGRTTAGAFVYTSASPTTRALT